MKRTTKYVALDVDQATTVASVREEGGRVIARTILPTAPPALAEAVNPVSDANRRQVRSPASLDV